MAKLANKIKNNKVQNMNANEMINLKAQMKNQIDDCKYTEAMDIMAELASKKLMDPEIMYMGAYCYMMTGDNERAVKWISNILSYEPNNVKARILLARICIMEDRTDEALQIFAMVITNLQNKMDEEDKQELEEMLDYYRYSEPDMLIEKYPAVAKFVGLEVPEKQEEAVPAEEEPSVDEATTRAKAAVAKLRALLNSKKQEEQATEPVQEVIPEVQPQPVEEKVECETNATSEDSVDVNTISQQIMSKPVSVKDKIKLFNTFAAGCYVSGDYQSAFDLLSGALTLDSSDPMIIKNLAYVCAAAGENEQAMEFVSKLPMVDFGILKTIK